MIPLLSVAVPLANLTLVLLLAAYRRIVLREFDLDILGVMPGSST
jgi:hypothetical protein